MTQKRNKPLRYDSGTKSNGIYVPFVILTLIVYLVYILITFPSNEDMILILPGKGVQDIIILFLIFPLIGIMLLILVPYIAMMYFKVYKLIFRNSKNYYLDMRIQLDKWSSLNTIARAIHPGLMICVISQFIVTITGIPAWFLGAGQEGEIFALFNASFVIFPIVIALFVPLWLLYDSGVMSKTNLNHSGKKRTPEIVETVDRFYMSKWKGFGGLAFVANIASLITQTILLKKPILVMVFVFFVPFIGFSLVIPTQTIYEKLLPYLSRRVHALSNLHASELTLVSGQDCPACNPGIWK